MPDSLLPKRSVRKHELSDEQVLYFLHIPKTAGTTFYSLLRSNFAADQSSNPLLISHFLSQSPETIRRYRLIGGHLFYNIQPIVQRDIVYITMMREPVARTVSHYSHLLRDTDHFAYQRVREQTLQEYIRDPENLPFFANVQTRYLGLTADMLTMYREMDQAALDRLDLEKRLETIVPQGFFDPEMAEIARQRLSSFAFVGVQDDFHGAIQLLYYTFGWKLPDEYTNLMVSPEPIWEPIDDETLQIIRANTELDQALYTYAKQLFRERYLQMVDDLLRNDAAITERAQLLGITPLDKEVLDADLVMAAVSQKISALEGEKTRLDAIEQSWGWRFILRMNVFRRSILPAGTRREALYMKLRNWFSGIRDD